LLLKSTFRGTPSGARSGRFACAQASSTKTRCSGGFQSADGKFGAQGVLTVTWSSGRPVAMAFKH
jgi:hypothetical protein